MIDYMYLAKFNYLKSSFPQREIAAKSIRMNNIFFINKRKKEKERKKEK